MLDLVLKGCGVWTRGDFAAIINDNDGLESFVDECRRAVAHAVVPPACIDASVQTETATATVGTTMDSFVNVREVGSMATFSPVTAARMVSAEVQCSPRMVQHAVQATRAARDASTSALVSTAMPARVITWWSALDTCTTTSCAGVLGNRFSRMYLE